MLKKQPIDTVYICDWLPPDFGAVGQYSLLFARRMAAEGQHVVLVGLTSGESRIETEARPGCDGMLTVLRLAAAAANKSSNTRRAIWTAKANTLLLRQALPFIRRARRVVFTGSPPLFVLWIMPVKILFHRPRFVYRITDFHPECAIAERGSPNSLHRLILRLALFWRRRVDDFEVLGHDQARRLREIGIASTRIRIKPDPAPITITKDQKPLNRPKGFADRTLLLYSGNWGVAHDIDTFVEGYTAHHRYGSGRVVLWLNAAGVNAERVERLLLQRGLPVHRSRPVPLERLAALLVTTDAHLITLSDAFVGYVLPSKVHGCVASGKHTLFVGSALSDVHRICAETLGERYLHADVGRPEAVAGHLDRLGTEASLAFALQTAS